MTLLPRLSTTAFFTLALVVLMASAQALIKDPDTLWHLAAGDLIRESGSIPRTDTWSFTAGNHLWFLLSWAWDAAASLLYAKQGWFGVALMSALIYAGALALLFSSCLNRTRDITAPFLTLLLGFSGLSLLARPQAVTLLMVILFARILHGVTTERLRLRHLRWLPMLMAVWANCHGGFLAGFTVLGAYIAQSWVSGRKRELNLLLVTAAFCTLAACINPYGIFAVEGALRSLHGELNTLIHEWQPVAFSAKTLMSYPLLVLFVALVSPRDGRYSFAERLLAYAWLFMALTSIRHMAVFIVLASPMMAQALDRLILRKQAKGGWPPMVRLAERLMEAQRKPATRILALLLPAATLAFLVTPTGRATSGMDTLHAPLTIAEEVLYVQQHYPQARLLAYYHFGGEIIYLTRGRLQVFIDSRADSLYPPEVARDYVAFATARPGWEATLERYRIDAVLIPPAQADPELFDRFIRRNGWRKALETPGAVLFVREKG